MSETDRHHADPHSGNGHAETVAEASSAWNGVEETTEDPEEVRVIFCALDSFW